MSLAHVRGVILDSPAPARLGPFWAAALDREWAPDGRGGGTVTDPVHGQPPLLVRPVGSPSTVKRRVHLDIVAEDLADLERLGARVEVPEGDDRHWTVMADPDGGVFCAFLRAASGRPRWHGVVVDSADHAAVGAFWQQVLGGTLVDRPSWTELGEVPGLPGITIDPVPNPDPKTEPNRVRFLLGADSLDPLLQAGAQVVRLAEDAGAALLADPEGNEFEVLLRG